MDSQLTYTQVIDEKSGEIKYVPNTPPTPPPKQKGFGGGFGVDDEQIDSPYDEDELQQVRDTVERISFKLDDKLTETLLNLMENNKRLRYNKRLQAGKLDSKRLTAYKTSDRLFKLKAIKDKHYQFTFLIDTSGSMMAGADDNNNDDEQPTRIQMAAEAVARTVGALKELDIRSSVFGMNCSFRLFKGFEQDLDRPKFLNDIFHALVERYDDDGNTVDCANGTSEWVAYEQATDYIAKNSDPKVTNVVIVISDGEPGGNGGQTQVIMGGEPFFVPNDSSKDHPGTLAGFWERRPNILAFGLGIGRKAKQVPTNRRIDDITQLPNVMGKLLTELML